MQRNSVKKIIGILSENKIISTENKIQVVYESFDWKRNLFESYWLYFPSTYDGFGRKRDGIEKIDINREGADGRYFMITATYKNKNHLPDSDDPIIIHPYMPSVKPTKLILPVSDFQVSLDLKDLENNKCSWTILTENKPIKSLQELKRVEKELLIKRKEIFS